MILASSIQLRSPITMTIVRTLGPRVTLSTIRKNSDGMLSIASVSRMIRLSASPPAYPATDPSVVPTTTATTMARNPMLSEMRLA